MVRIAPLATLWLAWAAAWAGEVESPASAVARLRRPDATYEDWRPILALGKQAVPELKKLLGAPADTVKAAAAVLLYRLGEKGALDQLDRLLGSADPDARKEAADALRAFTGGPAPAGAKAGAEARGAALKRWREWWKRNRQECLKREPCSSLFGTVVKTDGELAVVSLSERHGAKNGTTLGVRRGDQPVCIMQVVMPSAAGSVARIVPLSVRTPPRAGDIVFWQKP